MGSQGLVGATGAMGSQGLVGATGPAGSGNGIQTDYDMYIKPSQSPNKSIGWTIDDNSSAWDPMIRGANDRKGIMFSDIEGKDNDASSRFVDYDVPVNMRTAHIFYLPWNNSGYFDVWGRVGTESEWQFISHINAFQNVRNEERLGFHDGTAIITIPQVNKYNRIRIQGRKGRIHLMGIGWLKGISSSQANGFVNWESMAGSTKFNVNDDGNGLTIRGNGPTGQGRMHVYSEDELYILNKKGVVVGKEMGGSGNVNIQGNVQIDGGLCLGPADNNWCFTPNANRNWLDIRRNGVTGDKGDTGEFHLSQDGNLWLNRSASRGWVADIAGARR